jgi:hypothetical protein
MIFSIAVGIPGTFHGTAGWLMNENIATGKTYCSLSSTSKLRTNAEGWFLICFA